MKEITLQINDAALTVLEQEAKMKRDKGLATSMSDRLIIRLLGAINTSNALSFKLEGNKLVVKSFNMVRESAS